MIPELNLRDFLFEKGLIKLKSFLYLKHVTKQKK